MQLDWAFLKAAYYKDFMDLKERKRGGGVSDSWLDVTRGGGVIQMHTLCNGGWGVGERGSKNQEKMCM